METASTGFENITMGVEGTTTADRQLGMIERHTVERGVGYGVVRFPFATAKGICEALRGSGLNRRPGHGLGVADMEEGITIIVWGGRKVGTIVEMDTRTTVFALLCFRVVGKRHVNEFPNLHISAFLLTCKASDVIINTIPQITLQSQVPSTYPARL